MKKFKSNAIKVLFTPTVTRFGLVLSLTTILFGGTIGCNYNDLKNPALTRPVGAGQPEESSPEQVIDFETVHRLVFEPACTKCHGVDVARAGLRLDTYASAFAAAREVRVRVSEGTMPPPPPRGSVLSPEQQVLLLAWIDSGAPEKSVIRDPEELPQSPAPAHEPTPSPDLPAADVTSTSTL